MLQEAEISKVESKLLNRTVAQLNSMLDLLDLPRGTAETGSKVWGGHIRKPRLALNSRRHALNLAVPCRRARPPALLNT